MLIVRGTRKFLDRIGGATAGPEDRSTTALGDWYATVLSWKPQAALFVSEATLLPVVVPFSPGSSLMRRFPNALAGHLEALGAGRAFIDAEGAEMTEPRLAPTKSRSVIGIMVEFARMAAAYGEASGVTDLAALSLWLSDIPCGPLYRRHVTPRAEVQALIGAGESGGGNAACKDCGDPEASTSLGGVTVCDRCFDRRISAHTGLPRLPEPPAAITLTGPDGRCHRLRFRIWRAPTGIEVNLDEVNVPAGEGYRFAVLGDHDADADALVARVRQHADVEIGRSYLEEASHRSGWALRGDEVVGRLVWGGEGGPGRPYQVVVDGRTLTWEELGVALDSFEGWNFRLVIEDSIQDARSDADVIELRPSRPEP